MSNIIQLLERMGQDASLQTETNFEQAIAESALTESLKQALTNKDDISLKRELDVCPDVVCIMLPAEDEEKEKEKNEEQDENLNTD
ncbi:hypothetical protein L2747_12355 [Shewanella marinintestina]|uniref:hypothetical protein n=1 Tax=Shewanella marinintestina TaxID=190305 RepID=UPI00200C9F77|nr:hypothetical protein [Shewanella marinintestina]MCL1146791.1 hypothetical protein [Shewanella marinintestina]